ncbi:MAG: hypothetical protein KKF48_05880 [Nanoarchaeota archaeon]|nr:hypothetical protein [Nanoarchaeota archaeon]
MKTINYNSKNCLTFKDEYGNVNNFSLLLVAKSGEGKGLSEEGVIYRWQKTTNGIVIVLNDPKQTSEFSFAQYEPTEKYHLKELRRDGIKKNKCSVKLYHPFSFSISRRGWIPPIQFYTLSIKDMKKDDWSILAETDDETETIKLLERVSEYIKRDASLWDFLLEVERLTEGKNEKGKKIRDKKNWGLKGGGGTAKSIKQIGNMLSSFKNHYFLRKDTCELKLNWDKILLDNQNYHVFLTNWIDNPKLRNFLVVCLMGQAIREARRLSDIGKLKKPILFVVPELKDVCPSEAQGSAKFLAKSLSRYLVTIRGVASGMSILGDTQVWSGTHQDIRSGFKETFWGRLNPEDARIIFKAKSYTSDDRQWFEELEENYCSYIWDGNEDRGVFHFNLPPHMHKEEKYNWIQMYKKYHRDKMVRYDDLVNKMRKEFDKEESVIDKLTEKELKELEEQKRKSEETKVKKLDKENKEPKETIESRAKEYLFKRAWELKQDGLSDRKIGNELNVSHKTAKIYYSKYEERLKQEEEFKNNPDNIKPNLGSGILPEEIEMNFDNGKSSEEQ